MPPSFGYGQILSRALGMAWRYRLLWIFGILTQSSVGAIVEYTIGSEDNRSRIHLPDLGGLEFALLIPLLTFAFLLFLGLLTLRFIAEGGLIRAAASHVADGTVRVGDAWTAGVKGVLRVGAILLIGMTVLILVWIIGVAMPLLLGFGVHPLLGVLVGMFSVMLALGTHLFVWPVTSYALRAAVIDDRPFDEAWATGWRMMQSNLSRTVGIVLVRFLFLLGLAMVEFAILAMMIPPLIVAAVIAPPLAFLLALFLLAPVWLVLAGYVGSAGSYYWTLSYLRIRELESGEPISDM